jgi:hypothetical protein
LEECGLVWSKILRKYLPQTGVCFLSSAALTIKTLKNPALKNQHQGAVKINGYFQGDRKLMAPRVGFEPTTDRLTVDCSTAELSRKTIWRIAGFAQVASFAMQENFHK